MIYSGQPFDTPQDALEHFGVLGMHWGVRNEKPPAPTYSSSVDGKAIGSPVTYMDPHIHTKTQDAAYQVTALLKDRYGYEVNKVVAIPDKRRYKNLIAYVELPDGKTPKGAIHVQAADQSADLKKLGDKGWFNPGTANMRGIITHETAHSMFHAEQTQSGFLGLKTEGGDIAARQTAYKAAVKTAREDGIRFWNIQKNISGYAKSATFFEETEAELFSRYHWSEDNPRFIEVWGQTLHKELGVDPTPFRKVVNNG